ncbi:sugar ABC transporter ATP-binding protein [Intrasporangium sp.]|uniref:sugar ABC transporter ATP-binding protein n=1 Tax=Intrasporangium sp. TaxID=1925024 RepID=UPI003222203A
MDRQPLPRPTSELSLDAALDRALDPDVDLEGMPLALSVTNVSKTYGVTRALRNAHLQVRPGEVVSLVGGNGSGKSTLVKIMAGVVRADSGQLRIRGRSYELDAFTPADSRRCGLHMVHQHRTTFDELSVVENLSIGRGFETDRSGRIRWGAARRRATRLIEQYQIACRPDDLVGDLGPAAQTMLEIARALQDQQDASEGVLVLDEPTASLPPHEVEFLLGALKGFAEAGQGVLFISHRLDEVFDVSTRVTGLRDGQIVGTVPAEGLEREELIEMIAGRAVTFTGSGEVDTATTQPVLATEELTGGSVRGATLQVHPGEIVGVAGLAGSGRSTLLRLLFGAQRATGGTIRLRDQQVELTSPADGIRHGIAFVPENRPKDAVFPDLSVAENLTIGHLRPFVSLGSVRHRAVRRAGREAIVEYSVKAASEQVPIGSLSGGNQQKISVARWLATPPTVLLLDEPTQGVDVGARSEIWDIVRQAAAQGTAVLVVSSDLEELVYLSHRLVIMRDGRLVGSLASQGLSPEAVNHRLHTLEVGT